MRKRPHIKTFESFVWEDYDGDGANPGGKTYLFVVTNDTGNPDDFEAEVREQEGKVIYKVTAKDMSAGAMQHPSDMTGLRKYLIEKKRIKELDVIEPAESTSAAMPKPETGEMQTPS